MAKLEKAPTSMMRAAFLSLHKELPWKRQFPKDITKAGDVEFFVPLDDADVVFVYDALPEKKMKIKASQKVIFVASEPESVKRYQVDFLAQFDIVITTDRATPHPHRVFSQAGLPWFVGSKVGSKVGRGSPLQNAMSFEELQNHFPAKKKLISVVSSNKDFTPEYRARLAFVSRLREEFGDQIDVFGRGILDFADKRDVLDAYRYHIALENCTIQDYWTEKLADPFLTLTFPIYHGCPNIMDYFPANALFRIDIYEPETAIQAIKEIIHSDLAERNLEYLLESRRRVMEEHNLFQLLGRIVKQEAVQRVGISPKGFQILRAERHFLPLTEKLSLEVKDFVATHPRLRSVLRRAKHSAFHVRGKVRFSWRYATDSFFRSHQKWITDNPDEAIRYDYDLPTDARILDVGGYRGDFAGHFLGRYGARVTICEPVPKFASHIRERFSHDPRITVNEFGLSDRNELAQFDLSADASGAFGTSSAPKVTVLLRDAREFLLETGVEEWDLLKLNIEGGEYPLLERLMETDLIERMRYMQVQFHLHVPDAKAKYRSIAKRLRRTHRLQWRYPFVWESWQRLNEHERQR